MNLILKWLVQSLIIMLVAYLVPGFRVMSLASAIWLSLALGLLNIGLKPFLVLITLPLNIITLGLFTLVINALVLGVAARIVPGVSADSFGVIFLASLLMGLISMLIDRVE